MKLAESATVDGDRLVIKQTHDFNPVLDMAKELRLSKRDGFGESKLVGLIPMKLWAEWAKKWGVNAGDHAAMRDVVSREMNNSDNAHLRVWQGKY
jgi:hypothetical protein